MSIKEKDFNNAILFKHRLCNRILLLIEDLTVLNLKTLMSLSEEELIQLGKLCVPVHDKMNEIRAKKKPIDKEITELLRNKYLRS